jgi:hypothetical protein
MASAVEPHEDVRPRQPDYCPECGTAYEPLQEYCLECGARLPVNQGVVGVLSAAWHRRLAWYPGDWIWPTLAVAVVAVAAGAVAIAVGAGRKHGSSLIVATHNRVTVGPGAATGTVRITTGKLPTPPEPTTKAPPAAVPPSTPKPSPNAILRWPAGKTGWTVVLESIPVANGRADAVARARKAKADGLTQVGILDSSNYSSLHAGYYAIFAGVYGSRPEANSASSNAHEQGFPDAYVAQVTR